MPLALTALTLVTTIALFYNPTLSLPDVINASVMMLYATSILLVVVYIRFDGVYRFYSNFGIFFATIILIALSAFVVLVGKFVYGIVGLLGIIALLIFLIIPYVALLRFAECDAGVINNFS